MRLLRRIADGIIAFFEAILRFLLNGWTIAIAICLIAIAIVMATGSTQMVVDELSAILSWLSNGTLGLVLLHILKLSIITFCLICFSSIVMFFLTDESPQGRWAAAVRCFRRFTWTQNGLWASLFVTMVLAILVAPAHFGPRIPQLRRAAYGDARRSGTLSHQAAPWSSADEEETDEGDWSWPISAGLLILLTVGTFFVVSEDEVEEGLHYAQRAIGLRVKTGEACIDGNWVAQHILGTGTPPAQPILTQAGTGPQPAPVQVQPNRRMPDLMRFEIMDLGNELILGFLSRFFRSLRGLRRGE